LSFLAVAEPDAVAPQKPKFYSNNNSREANETPKPDRNTPDLKGKQTVMIRTETAPRTLLTKAKPQTATKSTKNQTEAQPEKEQTQPLQPQPVVKAGDLAQGTPQETPQQTEPPHPPRPRTLSEARAQMPSQIQGDQMYHPGGVVRVAHSAFDAKETQFGDYDAQLEEAVQAKWDDLLIARNFARDCEGRVTVHFYLNYDGSITEAKIADPTTVDTTWAYLCLESITDPAPFARWPDQMRREIGANVREMTFTFYYY
jgi:outer membrane biosynthesis protein TonB